MPIFTMTRLEARFSGTVNETDFIETEVAECVLHYGPRTVGGQAHAPMLPSEPPPNLHARSEVFIE